MYLTLIQEIRREKDKLLKLINNVSPSALSLKIIDGTGGKVSISDLIAYQIGWGQCLIRWYESGIKGETPEMPGEGFSSWDYNAIAKHFYEKYRCNTSDQQISAFQEVAARILEIAQNEELTGNLDRIGVWPWCKLSNGKQWPLSKWIQVNTVAPYKRAAKLLNLSRLKARDSCFNASSNEDSSTGF